MKLLFYLTLGILLLCISVYGQEELPASGDGLIEGSGSGGEALEDGSGSGGSGESSGGDEGETEASGEEKVEEEASGQEEASGENEASGEENASGEEDDEANSDEGSTEEEEDCVESGSGDDSETPKCSKKEKDEEGSTEEEEPKAEEEGSEDEEGVEEEGSEDEEEVEEQGSDDEEEVGEEETVGSQGTCDLESMDEVVSGCLTDFESRIQELEDTISSKEGGGLEDQIELVLVKKGVIDCENNTQCDDDKACLDSRVKRDRMLCEDPCERNHCPVQHSECIVSEHKFSCECKEGFHGNGTERCVPDGFTAEDNGKHYRIFDDSYVEFDNATAKCEELGARLPVLDSQDTVKIVKKYLEQSNFTVFEQWDRSSRRVWLGLILSPRSGLVWVDGARIMNYPVSSRLFVWEARRALSAEASYADNTRHYGFYIDGDIAKLPGGGRRGAAVLCELLSPPEAADPYAKNEPPQRSDYYAGEQNNYYNQQPPQNNPYYPQSTQAPPQNNPYQIQERRQPYYPSSRQQPNQARPDSLQPPRRQGFPPNYPI